MSGYDLSDVGERDVGVGESSNSDEEEEEPKSTPQWQWSTGKSDTKSNTKKEKKRFILPGEKKQIKKLHMARLREERAKKKSLRNKHHNENSGENDNLRWIERMRNDLEILAGSETELKVSDSDEDEHHLVFTNVHRVHVKLLKALALRYKLVVAVEKKKAKEYTLILQRTNDSYVPEPNSKDGVEIDDICVPFMSRDEYLNNPKRLERVRKIMHAKVTNPLQQAKKKASNSSILRRKRADAVTSFSTSVDFVPGTGIDVDIESSKEHEASELEQCDSQFAIFANKEKKVWKMMNKMGFESGKGLGPKEIGIKKPIAVTQRQKNLGLGA